MSAACQRSFSVKTPPRKLPNAARRSREYLTAHEVEQVMAAARQVGRHPVRDATLMLLMYRHGLRVAEAVALRWDAVDLRGGVLHVHRLKRGQSAVHPLRGPELRALRQLRRLSPPTPYVFVSERGGPLTARAARHIVLRAGQVAGLAFPIHPHMLRHACGFYLANKGIDTRAIQHYLGHCNIQHTVRYTLLTPHRFTDFWDD
jgi:type 1 fimbriae regulatory protein FimB/type 1 fimbriae regulatory protein FimE